MSWRSSKVQNSHLSTSGARGERETLNFSWASTHLNFFWTSLTLYSSDINAKVPLICKTSNKKPVLVSTLAVHVRAGGNLRWFSTNYYPHFPPPNTNECPRPQQHNHYTIIITSTNKALSPTCPLAQPFYFEVQIFHFHIIHLLGMVEFVEFVMRCKVKYVVIKVITFDKWISTLDPI